jgi:osmotically-inducible protein OsmY
MKTDAEIQQDVLRELKWDTRVEETDVGIEVDNGVVTLTGTVSTYGKRLAAAEAAHRVRGVLDVANDVEVKLPGSHARTDTEIALAARSALEWDVVVPADRIQTTVADGAVTLEGTDYHAHQREDAERAVGRLTGVRRVVNKLVVSGPPIESDEVRQEIEAALERRALRTAKHVQVTVHDGAVTVAGPVHSWAEREAVLGAARYTPGVRAVEDRLCLDWYH